MCDSGVVDAKAVLLKLYYALDSTQRKCKRTRAAFCKLLTRTENLQKQQQANQLSQYPQGLQEGAQEPQQGNPEPHLLSWTDILDTVGLDVQPGEHSHCMTAC